MKQQNCEIKQQQMDEGTISVPNSNNKPKSLQKIQNNRYLNQKIYELFLNDDLEQCLKVIESCKSDQYKIYMKALVFQKQFKLQNTLELLMECQIWNKTNYHYLKAIAHNFYLLGKYKSSFEVAKQAYQANTSDYEIMYMMAKISLALGDKSVAISHYISSINKQPNQQSYLQLAKIYIEQRKYVQAVQELNKALIISPQNPQIHHLQGEICLLRNDKFGAKQKFINALERDADNYKALFSLAALKQEEKQIQQSFDYLKQAYKHSPNSSALWNNLACNMLAKNKMISAYCCLKRALFLEPFKWDIHTNMAIIFMHGQKYVAAQMHIRTALKLCKLNQNQKNNSNLPFLYNLLGVCLTQLGDYINAEKSFIQGSKIDKDINCLCNYAVMLFKKGQKQKALKVLQDLESCNLSSEVQAKISELKIKAY